MVTFLLLTSITAYHCMASFNGHGVQENFNLLK